MYLKRFWICPRNFSPLRFSALNSNPALTSIDMTKKDGKSMQLQTFNKRLPPPPVKGLTDLSEALYGRYFMARKTENLVE